MLAWSLQVHKQFWQEYHAFTFALVFIPVRKDPFVSMKQQVSSHEIDSKAVVVYI